VLDPNGIPAEIITTEAVTGLLSATVTPDPATGGTLARGVSGLDCQDALHNLARLSLLTLNRDSTPGGGSERVRVHALVQRVATEHLEPEQVARLVRGAADALRQVWPDIERGRQHGQVLRANAVTLAERTAEALWLPGVHPVLWRAGSSLGEAGLVSAAIDYWTQLARSAETVLGPEHPDTLSTRNNLAYWRGEAGDAVGAAAACEQLLTDRLRVLGSDHPDTLSTRHNLADWGGQAGDAAGAAAAFAQLLTDRLRVLGPEHPDTLSTRHNLADWGGQAGDAAGAAAAFAQLLTDRLRVLGPEHPHTLSTRNNLAYWRGEAGDPAGAAAAFAQLLTDRLRVLGPDHPHTLSTRHNLAYWRGQLTATTQSRHE
jgi:hypothetical protein